MDFVANQEPQIQAMLAALGLKNIQELFSNIHSSLLLPAPSSNDGISEYEGMRLMQALADRNSYQYRENYLGAGAYEHHIPAIVGPICSKSEILTSYTPYQAEASQGMLQAIFEFQSVICALTGMDVANASVYDAASACAEALLMTLRLRPHCHKVLVAESLHPYYQSVVELYLNREGILLQKIPYKKDGALDFQKLKSLLDDHTAGVLIQSPNFFGCLEEVKSLASTIHQSGALVVLAANPLSYGLFASAGECDVDIAVGDCQPFGIPLNFGGAYVGYMACREDYIRQLPGRLIGETVDNRGNRGFVLTLQAREQHIRREKATSNICTNQALGSLASLIAILWYGKNGLRKLALTNYQRAHFLKNHLEKLPGFQSLGNVPFFNEFAIHFPRPIEEVLRHFRSSNIEPGISLEGFYPHLKNSLLIAVTETKSKEQLDRYVHIASQLSHGVK